MRVFQFTSSILLGLFLSGTPQAIYAGCGGGFCHRTVVQEAAVIATPVAVATFVPVAVAVPTYGVSYAPGYVGAVGASATVTSGGGTTVQAGTPVMSRDAATTPTAPSAPTAADLQALRDELAKLRQELANCKDQLGKSTVTPTTEPPVPPVTPSPSVPPTAAPTQPPAPPKPTAAVDPGVVLFKSHCAKCHDSSVSTAKGGKVALLSGDNFTSLDCKAVANILANIIDGNMPRGSKLTDAEKGQFAEWARKLDFQPAKK